MGEQGKKRGEGESNKGRRGVGARRVWGEMERVEGVIRTDVLPLGVVVLNVI